MRSLLSTIGSRGDVWPPVAMALVPSGVVTLTLATPVPAGETAVICVALSTVNDAAGFAPKATAVAPVKLVPVMTTLVPPAAKPLFGLRLVTVGNGTT